ncbi:MAG: ATP-dependent helicase [archaeon]|nr:ATP-dependent helicase [archaeon]
MPFFDIDEQDQKRIGRQWTAEEDRALVEEYCEQSLSVKTIAEMHGRTENGIRSRLKCVLGEDYRKRVPPTARTDTASKGRAWSEDDVRMLADLFLVKGLPIEDIASEMSLSVGTVTAKLRDIITTVDDDPYETENRIWSDEENDRIARDLSEGLSVSQICTREGFKLKDLLKQIGTLRLWPEPGIDPRFADRKRTNLGTYLWNDAEREVLREEISAQTDFLQMSRTHGRTGLALYLQAEGMGLIGTLSLPRDRLRLRDRPEEEQVPEDAAKADFSEANEEQRRAIECVEGPLLIVAGPGTGKTYTLIQRIVNLVVNHHVTPSRILMATFTVKAANEMLRRLIDELAKYDVTIDTEEMYIGDFHSICNRIIAENADCTGLQRNFSVKDEKEQEYFIADNLREFTGLPGYEKYIMTEKGQWKDVQHIAAIVNMLQEELIDAEDLLSTGIERDMAFGHVLEKYVELRSRANFLDYTSMQTEAYRLLSDNPEVAEKVLGRIDHVFIDEYQDTNHIQERLTFLLGSRTGNICVVGDEDQSIYRFRGATVRNILEFEDKFDRCTVVPLTRNYRSEPDIISLYNRWMTTTRGSGYSFSWDRCRHDKTIVAAGDVHPDRGHVFRISGAGTEAYHRNVLNAITDLVSNGSVKDYNQIVFLFSSVASKPVVELADYLRRHGIPVFSPRSRVFFQRQETRLALGSLLRLFENSMVHIRSIKDDRLRGVLQHAVATSEEFCHRAEGIELRRWIDLNRASFSDPGLSTDRTFSRLVLEMLALEPFRGMVDKAIGTHIVEQREAHNLSTLVTLLTKFEATHGIRDLDARSLPDAVSRLVSRYLLYLMNKGVEEYEDNEVFAPSGHVSFFTVHQSKGLEFPVVFLGLDFSGPWADQEAVPHDIIERHSGRPGFEQREHISHHDFWRKTYVALSRPQTMLFLLNDPDTKHSYKGYFEEMWNSVPDHRPQSIIFLRPVAAALPAKTYSFTGQINRFSVCPLQYYLYNELGFQQSQTVYTAFGVLMHEILEDINKAVLEKGPSAVDETSLNEWARENFRTLQGSTTVRITGRDLSRALVQCRGYIEWMDGRWDMLHDCETQVNVVQKDHIISGRADLVLRNGDGYEIVDYKTEQMPSGPEDYHWARVKRQLEIYAYLFEEKFGLKVNRMSAYYTSVTEGERTIIFERGEDSARETAEYLENVIAEIGKGDFSRRCDNESICRHCDFRHYCGRVVTPR